MRARIFSRTASGSVPAEIAVLARADEMTSGILDGQAGIAQDSACRLEQRRLIPWRLAVLNPERTWSRSSVTC